MILRASGWTHAFTKSQNPSIGKAEEKGALRWRVCKLEGSVAGSPGNSSPFMSERIFWANSACEQPRSGYEAVHLLVKLKAEH